MLQSSPDSGAVFGSDCLSTRISARWSAHPVKITRISVYQVDLPMKEGSYSWSTQSFSAFDSTVVAIETDEGHHWLR